MKVIDEKTNPDGSSDLTIEFSSEEEAKTIMAAAEEKGMSLNDFIVQMLMDYVKDLNETEET